MHYFLYNERKYLVEIEIFGSDDTVTGGASFCPKEFLWLKARVYIFESATTPIRPNSEGMFDQDFIRK